MDPATTAAVLEKGGLVAVILIGLYFYRRDAHRALNSWQQQTKILTELVQKVATTMQANTDAVIANTAAVGNMERKLPHACPMAQTLADDAVAQAARDALRRVR